MVGDRVGYQAWQEFCHVWLEFVCHECLGQSGIWTSFDEELWLEREEIKWLMPCSWEALSVGNLWWLETWGLGRNKEGKLPRLLTSRHATAAVVHWTRLATGKQFSLNWFPPITNQIHASQLYQLNRVVVLVTTAPRANSTPLSILKKSFSCLIQIIYD